MISKHSAEHYTWGGDCDGWHLVKSAGLSVIHERMPPDRAEVRHHHVNARQLFFVLSGELSMRFDERTETLRPGQAVEVAPGERHQAANHSQQPTEFLVISAPSTRGDRIEMP